MTTTRVPLSPGRRHIADLCWLSLRVPRCILRVQLDVARLQAARAGLAGERPAWPMLFAKGFAMAARHRPALRRIHASLPTPRLLEVQAAIGCILVERLHEGQPMVMAARFQDLATTPLPELGRQLAMAKNAPVSAYRPAYRVLRMLRIPWPIRRALLLWGLALAGPVLRQGGTFAVSSVGQHGAAIVDSVSPLPAFLTFGPIDAAGQVEVHLVFDHRVMDGGDAAEALQGLQSVMAGALAEEVEGLRA